MSAPTLSAPRRAVALGLGGLLVAAAVAALGVVLARAGVGLVALYLSGIAALTAVLLGSGVLARPPRWRAARLLLGVLALVDVLVVSFATYFAPGVGDTDARTWLQAANWLLAIAAPLAIGVGLPRRTRPARQPDPDQAQ